MPLPLVLEFGHPPRLLEFWRRHVRAALGAGAATPFHFGACSPAKDALGELDALDVGVPVRNWLSCKTQPAAPMLRWWRMEGRPIEVVSEFEFRAACAEGFEPDAILVNGPAKHRWLGAVGRRGLRVHFDSMAELQALAVVARRLDWKIGLRLRTRGEVDPENPDRPTQFGFEPAEFLAAVRWLRRRHLVPQTVSFHLRTNVRSPEYYERAVAEAAAVCNQASFQPRHLDCGGGLPPPYVLTRRGRRFDTEMNLGVLARSYRRAVKAFPGVKELWLENGRFVLARTAVLAIRVLEVKRRGDVRQLICDGGRTLNALLSTWEHHELLCLPRRRGALEPTVVHGPTCMAFDQLGFRWLPGSVRVDDVLIWLDAGAYHLPWETHFSHGLAAVWWDGPSGPELARAPESFASYWGRWRSRGR